MDWIDEMQMSEKQRGGTQWNEKKQVRSKEHDMYIIVNNSKCCEAACAQEGFPWQF